MQYNVWEEPLFVNPAQLSLMLLPAKTKYALMSRASGKSFITGYEIDENVRLMPRGITTVTQATIGQALTKTLPSAFKMLELLGYKRYDPKTQTGDYVVCRRPPEGWYRPYEHVMNTDYLISFSNGHCLYILSQATNSRGPNADYNISDEALTLDKEQFDQEVAPTNRGNEHIFGRHSTRPLLKHHGNTYLSSMAYTPEQKWLLDPASYYEEERGIHLVDEWNKIVSLQLQLIDAQVNREVSLFKDIWNEIQRKRRRIIPFVSKDGILFLLGSIFDNIGNVGMNYVISQYNVMDKFSFMVEILNYIVDKIDHCYYNITDRHRYYHATNDSYIRDFAENVDFNWKQLAEEDSRMDMDCNPNKPLEVTPDWGSAACFLEVAQCGHFDFAAKRLYPDRVVDNTINEFFVKREDTEGLTEVDALIDMFCRYYRFHPCKTVDFYRDRYGDARRANSKKTYNQCAIDRLMKHGWTVVQHVHRGMEPPQHDKYLLWSYVLAETDTRYPVKRFNATKCKFILISMNNTRVRTGSDGRYEKDKRSERNGSIPAEEATHFGDCVDKRMWTKYGDILTNRVTFVDNRI